MLLTLPVPPCIVLHSNSKRTMQTMETMTEAYKELSSVDIHFIASWYTVAALDGQTRQHIEEVIRGTAADAKCVSGCSGCKCSPGSAEQQIWHDSQFWDLQPCTDVTLYCRSMMLHLLASSLHQAHIALIAVQLPHHLRSCV